MPSTAVSGSVVAEWSSDHENPATRLAPPDADQVNDGSAEAYHTDSEACGEQASAEMDGAPASTRTRRVTRGLHSPAPLRALTWKYHSPPARLADAAGLVPSIVSSGSPLTDWSTDHEYPTPEGPASACQANDAVLVPYQTSGSGCEEETRSWTAGVVVSMRTCRCTVVPQTPPSPRARTWK